MSNPSAPASGTAPGPGAQLLRARLDLKLSREEVAGRLHLSVRQVEALETNDYRDLPGPTYVRGYLRSYATLLGLPADEVLETHARMTARPVQQDFSAIAPQKEITSSHHRVRFTTYLLAIIVIGLAVAWWSGRETRPPGLPSAPPSAEAPAPAPTAKAEAESPAPAFPATAVEEHKTEPPAPGVAKLAPPSPAPVSPAKTPVPSAAPPAPATAAVPAPALPAGPRGKLVINADQDTWVDVRDARQVKLMYETVAAGRVVKLEGVAPLSVFLGNAAGARLEYNGRAVDVTRYKRGMVARFTLGEEEAAVAPNF